MASIQFASKVVNQGTLAEGNITYMVIRLQLPARNSVYRQPPAGTISAVKKAALNNQACRLLNVASDPIPDNTIFTVMGPGDEIVNCLMEMAVVARDQIDVSQRGEDKIGLGALDTCAFSPYQGVTMDDCIDVSKEFGKRLATEIDIPVYLLWESATNPHFRGRPPIVECKVAGFEERLRVVPWNTPNYGPARSELKWCATLEGAQKFTPMFNVTVKTNDKKKADDICFSVRTSGPKGGPPGCLKAVKATTWLVEEVEEPFYQIAMYLLDTDVTGLHDAYEACREKSKKPGVEVLVDGSEVVGMIPLKVMLAAGAYYRKKEGLPEGTEQEKIETAIDSLGLNKVRPFDPETRILDQPLTKNGIALVEAQRANLHLQGRHKSDFMLNRKTITAGRYYLRAVLEERGGYRAYASGLFSLNDGSVILVFITMSSTNKGRQL
ncbi:formimidoyltransferase-cyclodeaminase-like [Diadema setosum]|uniref:formimidoyltransferase-cyclodeaminase-like n=1 Tax=Diadema setosum TaxID=31175 RepID=UPI003B3AD034